VWPLSRCLVSTTSFCVRHFSYQVSSGLYTAAWLHPLRWSVPKEKEREKKRGGGPAPLAKDPQQAPVNTLVLPYCPGTRVPKGWFPLVPQPGGLTKMGLGLCPHIGPGFPGPSRKVTRVPEPMGMDGPRAPAGRPASGRELPRARPPTQPWTSSRILTEHDSGNNLRTLLTAPRHYTSAHRGAWTITHTSNTST